MRIDWTTVGVAAGTTIGVQLVLGSVGMYVDYRREEARRQLLRESTAKLRETVQEAFERKPE
jgi:hypothetical protein